MFASIDEGLDRIARGEMIIVVDGPGRENEGDLTMAADFVTADAVNFMIRHGRGLVCMPCESSRLEALDIPPMVPPILATSDTPFAVPIDHVSTTTGISAPDRAMTIRSFVDEDALPSDFRRPGHVFPLRARAGGVLHRAGHTEAAVDLCRLAGLSACGVICEVLSDDGTCSRVADLRHFASVWGIAIVSVDDLIAHRMSQAARAASA